MPIEKFRFTVVFATAVALVTVLPLVHADEAGVLRGVVLDAAGEPVADAEVAQPVDVLGGEDLLLRKQSTLGETLAQQPGVTASTYGQGSSRPVIRGLGADGIRILENGLDTGDVSTIGGSYVADRGFIGVALGGYDTEYGIPGHHHHHHEEPYALKEDHEEEEVGVYADLEQRRIDLHGQLDEPFRLFSAVKLSAGWRDYNHREMEGDVVGTRFDNRWAEGRLDFVNEAILGFSGTLGLQVVKRDFAAAGEEAFVEPTDTATPGYEMVNASLVSKIFAGKAVHELVLRGRNLTDGAAYNHVSFLKTNAPLPGRDVALIYRLLL